jgi:hypothetical protein
MPIQHEKDAGDRTNTDEQAITIKAPLETVERGWVKWCASGHAKLRNDYAVRFEPAAGERETDVYLSGGGSTSAVREELSRFKHELEKN